MIAGRAALVASRVELANNASFTVRHVPDKGARVSFSGEDFGSLVARVVDTELDAMPTSF